MSARRSSSEIAVKVADASDLPGVIHRRQPEYRRVAVGPDHVVAIDAAPQDIALAIAIEVAEAGDLPAGVHRRDPDSRRNAVGPDLDVEPRDQPAVDYRINAGSSTAAQLQRAQTVRRARWR